MHIDIRTSDVPAKYFIYLNGRPVNAVAANSDEGWVDLMVTDRHNKLIQHLNDSLEIVTARAKGFVQILKRDKPPEDWDVDMSLGEIPFSKSLVEYPDLDLIESQVSTTDNIPPIEEWEQGISESAGEISPELRWIMEKNSLALDELMRTLDTSQP